MMIKVWKKSEFIRSVSTLMTGTVVAQLISYLIYPLITRIYSQDEMGDLGLYMRWVALIAAIATARYEVAVPIPKEESKGFLLYRLALRIGIVTVLASFVLFCLYYTLQGWTQNHLFFAVLVVFSAYSAVWINSSTAWAVRRKNYRQISTQRIVNSFGVNGFRYAFGLIGWGSVGLLLGSFLGSAVSGILFLKEFFGFKKHKDYQEPKSTLKEIAREYEVYPKVNLMHVILDMGVDVALASLIVLYYDKASFGSFSHAYLMLKLPISLVGQSVGQVFYQHCSKCVNEGRTIYPDFIKTVRSLILIGILPFTILFFYGETLFPFVFGEQWQESGRFAEWMAPMLFVNFIISPLSTLMLVLNKQREAFWIALVVAGLQLFSFGILPLWNWTLTEAIIFNFGIMAVVLLIVLFIYNHYARQTAVGSSIISKNNND